MPKQKGIAGGRTVELTKDAHDNILQFLLGQFDPTKTSWNHNQRAAFTKKARKFEVRDNGQKGGWPNGPVLYKKFVKKNAVAPAESKLYVPTWEKDNVLKRFHGGDARGGHYGRNRLHALVCE